MRMTKQKKVILEVLKNTTSHPTADWVYEQAKKQIPDISLGTVYRNLNVLRDMGEIKELNYSSSQSRFDGNPVDHYHFNCENCHRVYDLNIPVKKEMAVFVEKEFGHRIDSHRLEFYGVCKECRDGK